MTAADFCSRVSQADEGVFPGTAVRGEIYVLLPVEKRLWGRNELNGSWAAPAELDAIRRARRAGVTTRLYNPPRTAEPRCVLVHASPSASTASRDMAAGMIMALARHGWTTETQSDPCLAICVQGTRDRCCAKWGFSVYREASRLWRQGRFPFEPLECSHLGGDRYAATGIVFPSGNMYGHLDRVDLQALGDTETNGRIFHGHYRGRVFEGELTQIVRAGLSAGDFGVDATSAVDILNPEAAPGHLTVAANGMLFQVSLATIESEFFGSCDALAQARVSRTRRIVFTGAARL